MSQKRRYTTSKILLTPLLMRLIYLSSIAVLFYYLWWRLTSTFNPQALVFSWVLWLAEAFGVFNYLLFAWMTQDVSAPYPHREPKAGLCVDVFVPTYDESLEILEATLIGCRGIRYPHQTYVLDDGKRPEVAQLASRLDSIYIARPTNEYAKAGNINYALTQTRGEFIVILDADMVPQPDYLDRTLGYFTDEKLAFVQLPQEFYNQDSIQHDNKAHFWHEQSLFFRVLQPGKNWSNSAFWCGSPSILRRTALEDVGGIATETITEDIHTSVRLHSRGWSSLFLNEALAFGIAPQTIKAFLLQRLRWAQGTMQLYRSKESPLWIPGLTIRQRLSYLSSFLAYFESFQKLVLIMTPTFIILFNVFPMSIDALTFLWYWLPYYFISMLANLIGGRGYFRHYQTEKFNLLKMVVFIQSTLMLVLRKPLRFKVTPKSVGATVYHEERQALRAYMAVLGFITGTLAFGLIRLLTRDNSVLHLGITIYLIAYFWTSYNAILIFAGILEVLRKQHKRRQYRFPVKIEGELYDRKWCNRLGPVQVHNLSIGGVNFSAERIVTAQKRLLLQVNVHPDCRLLLPIDSVRYTRANSHNQMNIGASFASLRPVDHELLFSYLFVEIPRQRHMDAPPTSSEELAPQPRLLPLQPPPSVQQKPLLPFPPKNPEGRMSHYYPLKPSTVSTVQRQPTTESHP